MSVKYTTEAEVKKLEEMVAYYQRAINKVKDFSRGGKDGLKAALEVLKELRNEWARLKDAATDNPNHVRQMRALLYRGQEKGLDVAIGLFERPKEQINFYEQQVSILQKQLDAYKHLPKR